MTWTGPTSGSGNAVQVSSPPGAWPNTSPTSFWDAVNASATLPGGTGDNVQRYSYSYGQTWTGSSTSPLQMTVWTDNYFQSYVFNGNLVTVSPLAPPPGDFGQPSPRVFMLDPVVGMNTLTLNTTGDGLTDGVNVGFQTVPEPSSIALLGTGLFGLAPMMRRRRKG